ncbi:dipeptidase [Paenibacillus sp. FSL W8-1187]|uniref:dipeptidase n=1 Tax=Paenibacillus sp. FSL W8-1187 TaxID=2975339 RepID=UPI0030DD9B42
MNDRYPGEEPRIADFHCDVLSKLLADPRLDPIDSANNRGPVTLDATLDRQRAGGYMLQAYAIYLTESKPKTMDAVLRSADLFEQKIASHPGYAKVRGRRDLERALQEGKIAALLTLEGADALQGDWALLRTAFALGVRVLGLTWNYANWAADGVLEPRQGGLTAKGRELVDAARDLGLLLDVSHLTDAGFWELVERTERPLIASHSNSRRICPHPRNLTDDQLRALIAMDGRIGLTYVPYFITDRGQAAASDLLPHIEHICSLGGEDQLMLGSDFDGIEQHPAGLRHAGEAGQLRQEVERAYGAAFAEKLLGGNAIRFLRQNLPE